MSHTGKADEQHLCSVSKSKDILAPLRPEQENTFILDVTSELISFQNRNLEIVWANRAASQCSGREPEHLAGRHCYEIWQKRDKPCPDCPALKTLGTGEPQYCEQTTPDGRVWDVCTYPVRGDNGKLIGAVETKRDVTEKKRTEKTLRKINRALAVLSKSNGVLVRARNEQTLLREVCQILVRTGGYKLVWVGYTACGPRQRIIPVVHAGTGKDYLDILEHEMAATDGGYFLPRIALATRKPCLVENLHNIAWRCTWAQRAVEHGYRSAVALPLLNNGSAFGALSIYSGRAGVFSTSEIRMLRELADDLVYGITTLRTRVDHKRSEMRVKHSLNKLSSTLEETVNALSSVVEKRDCYTAGHQRRVTRLACAIAKEIGLPAQQMRGIRFAGLLHDIGKISIPSEILTKPTCLSKAEFAIVRTHPHVGYDIVKSIEFPWPVAQIMLQHHERMDGSGYPQGLRRRQILMEARIMAVADVVEAMSSDRPYRPARSMDVTIEEIASNSDILYDSDVVDVCLHLLQRKGFKFETFL